jgi:uncharacterized cofD-like protein
MPGGRQKIVTIGGGTGSFTILSGLKCFDTDLSAVVSMADDGGSTGVLRDELGVLPPGDIRQCLVALSTSGQVLRELFNYRYSKGGLGGHNFGNIFLSTLEKITGNFKTAVRETGQLLNIRGRVIPVTLNNIQLVARLADGKKIIGEHKIDGSDLSNLEKIYLSPSAVINPEAKAAIASADKIIINPGNLFCSIIPNFLVRSLGRAVLSSSAKKIYVCNLMTKRGHTDNFKVGDYVKTVERFLGGECLDYVIYNKEIPEGALLKRYSREGEYLVKKGNFPTDSKINFLGFNLLSKKIYKQKEADPLRRTLIRHDSEKLAQIIYQL